MARIVCFTIKLNPEVQSKDGYQRTGKCLHDIKKVCVHETLILYTVLDGESLIFIVDCKTGEGRAARSDFKR